MANVKSRRQAFVDNSSRPSILKITLLMTITRKIPLQKKRSYATAESGPRRKDKLEVHAPRYFCSRNI